MRVIYLDFDGVLHPADVWLESDSRMRLGDSSKRHALFENAPLLVDMIAPHRDVKLVLSTSWVFGLGFERALAQLPEGLAGRVIGATFDPFVHGKGFGDIARGYQVQGDAQRRRLTNWMALDDDARDWPEEDLDRLIRTDSVLGLNASRVQSQLRAWLENEGGH
jgi:hypothetical protein